jgi:hypothetical protein
MLTMAPTPSPYDPPHVPAPRTRALRNTLIACGAVLVTGALSIGSCALFLNHVGNDDMNPLVDSYFARVDQGDYRGEYAAMGAALRAASPESDFVTFEEGVHAQLGPLTSRKLVSTQAGFGTPGGAWALAVYDGQFARGETKVSFRFQKEHGAWTIEGVHYDTPLLYGSTSPEPKSL